jgi:AraC-like DNA-binding protein
MKSISAPLLIFLVVLVAIIVGFTVLGIGTSKTLQSANELLSSRVAAAIEQGVSSSIDAALWTLNSSAEVQAFFEDREQDPFVSFQAVRRLQSVISADPLMESTFLVRWRDGVVLHNEYVFTLDQLPNRSDILAYRSVEFGVPLWQRLGPSAPTFGEREPVPVVPVVYGYPLFFGDLGLAVLNVSVQDLRQYVANVIPSGVRVVSLSSVDGHEVVSVGSDDAGGAGSMVPSQGFVIDSRSTRLRYTIELANEGWIGLFTVVTWAWMMLGAILLIFALGGYYALHRIIDRQRVAMVRVRNLMKSSLMDSQTSTSIGSGTGESDLNEVVESVLNRIALQRSLEEEKFILERRVFAQDVMQGTVDPEADDFPSRVLSAGIESDDLNLTPLFVLFCDVNANDRAMVPFAYLRQRVLEELIIGELVEPESSGLTYWADRFMLGVLLVGDGEVERATSGSVTAQAHTAINKCMAKMGLRAQIVIGEVAKDWRRLAVSARQARTTTALLRRCDGPQVIESSNYQFVSEVQEAHLVKLAEVAESVLLDSSSEQELSAVIKGIIDELSSQREKFGIVRHLLYSIHGHLTEYHARYRDRFSKIVLERFHHTSPESDLHALVDETLLNIAEFRRGIQSLDLRGNRDLSERLVAMVDDHLTDPNLSLKLLASEFQTSVSTISKLFLDRTGTGFAQYLSHQRMEIAKTKIRTTTQDIGEICFSAGYTNYTAFSRAFKREVGLSPSQYRRRARD